MQEYVHTMRLKNSAVERPKQAVAQEPSAVLVAPGPDFSLNRLYYLSDAERPSLRIGVMIDRSRPPPLFMRKVLEDVRNCNFATLECVIENCEAPARPVVRPSLPVRVARAFLDAERRQHLLYDAYMQRLNGRAKLQFDPCVPVDCSDLLVGVRRIEVVPLRKRFVHRFPAEAVEEIRALDLDVILRFGFNIIRGDILRVARHGVWSFHHGDSEHYRGGPPMQWEMIEGNPLFGTVLQRLDESLDAGTVLCRGLLATSSGTYVKLNRYSVYWTTQHFVIRKLYELHRYGPRHIEQRARSCGEYRGKRPIYRTPTNVEMARWLAPMAARTAARKLLRREQSWHWQIALRRSAQPLYRRPESAASEKFAWLDAPRGRFWADPFLIEQQGATWIFFEDYSYADRRGVISCGRLENGRLQDVRTALDLPQHLSFPYVFEHDGAVWMVPESEQARAVQLYRAVRFPDQWALERTLLDLRAVDSVPFQHQDRWWMFTSPVVVHGHAPFTLLFTAPQLFGPWTLHPAGCISDDVRVARCAGRIIRDGDRLIRVSQECAEGYGHSVCFSTIKLDEQTYEEKLDTQLLPQMLGTAVFGGVHTYNRLGDWEVIDGRRRVASGSHP